MGSEKRQILNNFNDGFWQERLGLYPAGKMTYPLFSSATFYMSGAVWTGTGWILVYFIILDSFTFWVGSEKCLENGVLTFFFGSQCNIQGNINATIYFGNDFWLEGPTDLRSTLLSYIFHALFRDIPLGHVYRAQPIIYWKILTFSHKPFSKPP